MNTISTREQILDVSLKLFCCNGFHAISVDRIIKSAGIAKATFYHHFESKDQLIFEVVDRHSKWWVKVFSEELNKRGGDNPEKQLRAVFDIIRDSYITPELDGCLFISAVTEFPSPKDPIHQAARATSDATRVMLTEIAADAGIEDPYEFGQQFLIVVEGAIVTEVIYRKKRVVSFAAKVGNMLIDRALMKTPALP